MDDSIASPFDTGLERLSKIAGLFIPIVIAAVGWNYTRQKDKSDDENRAAQTKRDSEQRAFDNKQKQYSNFVSLMPLLTSDKSVQVKMGLQVYASEAKALQAPTDLQVAIMQLPNQFPEEAALAQRATDAGREQQKEQCTANPDGIYIQVANNTDQLDRGKDLAQKLKAILSWPVQGVQRIDQGPTVNQLRFYYSPENNVTADKITSALSQVGIPSVKSDDLSQRYLKPGCPAPHVFELWIGSSTPLNR